MTTRHWQSRIVTVAALALGLALLPGPAAAQGATRKTGATARKAPPPERAPAEPSLIGRMEVEGALGLAIPFKDGLDTGFKLGGGAFFGVQQLAPGVTLQVGGTLAWTYNGYSSPIDGSLNSVDLLPTARIRSVLQPRTFIYGDAGLGIGIVHASVTTPGFPPFVPSQTATSTDAALLIKLGGGIGYDLQPNLALVFEPALNFYVKNGSITQLTLLAGLLYRP